MAAMQAKPVASPRLQAPLIMVNIHIHRQGVPIRNIHLTRRRVIPKGIQALMVIQVILRLVFQVLNILIHRPVSTTRHHRGVELRVYYHPLGNILGPLHRDKIVGLLHLDNTLYLQELHLHHIK